MGKRWDRKGRRDPPARVSIEDQTAAGYEAGMELIIILIVGCGIPLVMLIYVLRS